MRTDFLFLGGEVRLNARCSQSILYLEAQSIMYVCVPTHPVMAISNVSGSESRTHPPMAGHSIVLKCSCGGGLVIETSWRASNISLEQLS